MDARRASGTVQVSDPHLAFEDAPLDWSHRLMFLTCSRGHRSLPTCTLDEARDRVPSGALDHFCTMCGMGTPLDAATQRKVLGLLEEQGLRSQIDGRTIAVDRTVYTLSLKAVSIAKPPAPVKTAHVKLSARPAGRSPVHLDLELPLSTLRDPRSVKLRLQAAIVRRLSDPT